MPGMRPTMGGPGIQPTQNKTGGTLGVMMPMYTIAIIVFFVYTTFKVSLAFLLLEFSWSGSACTLTKLSLDQSSLEPTEPPCVEVFITSVSARWRVPYAVEENLRGMNERMKERQNDRKTKSRAFYY